MSGAHQAVGAGAHRVRLGCGAGERMGRFGHKRLRECARAVGLVELVSSGRGGHRCLASRGCVLLLLLMRLEALPARLLLYQVLPACTHL